MSSPHHTRGMAPLDDRIRNIHNTRDLARSIPTPTMASIHTRAHKIFEKVKSCWNEELVDIPAAATIRLRRSGYRKLLQLLAQDKDIEQFAFRRLKLFYDNQRRRLSYEMVTKVHTRVTKSFEQAIHTQLGALEAKSEEAKKIVGLFINEGDARITIGEDKVTKKEIQVEPDSWWILTKGTEEIPSFFLEVAFSQTLKAVRDKVRKIIYKTNGHPGLAVIIKLSYATPKQLANPPADRRLAGFYEIFKWTTTQGEDGVREKHIIRLHHPREFRNNRGELVPGKLSITLRDLVGETNLSKIPNLKNPAVVRALDEIVEIDHSNMALWLEKLESSARAGHIKLHSDDEKREKEGTQDWSLLPEDDTVDGMKKVIVMYSDDEQDETDTSTDSTDQ